MVESKLKEYREKKNAQVEFRLTKAHLADQMKVSRSYIAKVENGEITPHMEKAYRLAAYFDCRIDELFPFKADKR